MRFIPILVAIIMIACHGSEPASDDNTNSTKAEHGSNISAAALETVKSKPDELTVTGLFAAKGEDTTERVIYRDALLHPPELPSKSVDILAVLGIKLVNEMPEETGITDDIVRAAADVSYTRLGIADKSLKEWTLFVRLTGNGMNTTGFNDKKKFIIFEVDPVMFPYIAPHEMTHALSGQVARDNWIPGILSEFVATAAEIYQPPGAESNPFTYEVLNRPILGTGKNINGESDRVHAQGAPLDPLRYELLRQAGKKIGSDAYRGLASAIYNTAVAKNSPITMDDLKPAFDKAGLGDCVLFTHTTEPGVYVDVNVAEDHSPIVLIKYIDGAGEESMPQAPFSITWRKGGRAVQQYQGPAVPVFTDNGSVPFGGMMDEYVVKVGNLTYTYTIKNRGETIAPDEVQETE